MPIKNIRKNQWLLYSKFQPYFDRFIWSSINNFCQSSDVKRDFKITHSKAIVQGVCKKLIDRVIQRRKVITVQDMYTKVTKRVETEIKKARKALN